MPEPVAVLVDGENISAKHAEKIRTIAAGQGVLTILRVYGDAQRPSEWHSAAGYNVVHSGTGKNAADILLAIEAMELLLSRDIRRFVIVSSDRDFTHVATRLREHGAKVVGVGETKAPDTFRATCTNFVEVGQPEVARVMPCTEGDVSDLDVKIRGMIAQHSKHGAGMRISDLAPKMHRQYGVRISSLPEGRWRAYLAARPTLYDLDPRGPDAMVRFLAESFMRAA